LFEDKPGHEQHLKKGIKTYHLQKKGRLDFFRILFQVRSLIRRYRPTTVVSFLHYVNIVVMLATIGLRHRSKIILSERNYPPQYLRYVPLGFLKRWLMKATYRHADLVVPNSVMTEVALNKEFNVSREKLQTIYNPINTAAIYQSSLEPVNHPFFNQPGYRTIISVGRLVPQKRFDRLIKAFAEVQRNHQDIRMIILGTGPLEEELKKIAKTMNVNDCISFVGFQTNPFAWMAKADIFVLSSDYEGFPNVILEAMACGVPVISTDCCSGPNEIITHGENGYLSSLDDKKLALLIGQLLDQPHLLKQFSAVGQQTAQKFKIENIFPAFEKILTDQLPEKVKRRITRRHMKKDLKNIVVWLTRYLGLNWLIRRFVASGRVTIATYHNPDPEIFEQHVRFLSERYSFISLTQLTEAMRKKDFSLLPKNSLVITFDDGYKENRRLLPIFIKYHIQPTIYLCTHLINTSRNFWFTVNGPRDVENLKWSKNEERLTKLSATVSFDPDKEYPEREVLNTDEISEMKPFVSFGAHTQTHPILTSCNETDCLHEITQSKISLDGITGQNTIHFSYPCGRYSDREIKMVTENGYQSSRTCDWGWNGQNTNPYKLRSMMIDDHATLNVLDAQITGICGYLHYLLKGSLTGKHPQ
ncbi:MAG: glycosyltransferase, partial [Candidatus Omnitrophica bacterium]|nr:glycosyltransferase [Candidatus Omnitrophota bacterium]